MSRRHVKIARVRTDEQGTKVQPLRPYGIGIDTHKEFIQVCVLVMEKGEVKRYEREFSTLWKELQSAREWARGKLELGGLRVDVSALAYTIESTGTYHFPVLLAWGGVPSVVNPVLAGPTKRKTDVLDARMLAYQAMSGTWPESFLPTREAEALRVVINMRNECGRNATRTLNRINNMILRFGHTLGVEGSMADARPRAIIEDMCKGLEPAGEAVSPNGIPEPCRPVLMKAYAWYDMYRLERDEFHKQALKVIREREWPVGTGSCKGSKLLNFLQSVPGVGEVTAMTWLSVVTDPRRFVSPKQVAAYCGCDPSLKVSAGKVTSHVKRRGNPTLHHALKNISASLVRRHSEPIGQWGFCIQRRHAKGGWARAINAVSRRLAIFLWQVHMRSEEFSFAKYRFADAPQVADVPIEEMQLGARHVRLLKEAGLSRSQEIANQFHTTLPQQKGIGATCLQKVKAWLEANRQAVSFSKDKSSDGPARNSRTRIREKSGSKSTIKSSATGKRSC
jgi:hypothetical protein